MAFLLLAITLLSVIPHLFYGAPVAPNSSSCHLPTGFPEAEPLYDCCAPAASYSPRLFRPSASPPSSLRLRRPSHLASPAYAAKLVRAYSLMKALPPDDPRSFYQQANIHCAYCNPVYDQLYSTQLFQVHKSWLFLPFHRWYLYFHERILAKLLDDDTFALTFWNYDNHNATSIPPLYDSYSEILVSFARDPLRRGPNTTAPLDRPVAGERTRELQLQDNDNLMYRIMLSADSSNQQDFFGFPYRRGDSPMPGYGTVEYFPHNVVHVWVGNKTAVGLKDMGSFYAAPRDPVFYAHHAQLDRLWEVWKTFPDHEELADDDYLNSEFLFYNEDAELVRVRVGDALNITLLGYAYEDAEMPWLEAVITNISSSPAKLTPNSTICKEGEAIVAPCSILLQSSGLDQLVHTRADRSPWLDHRLMVKVQGNSRELGGFIDVYVNLPSADNSTGSGCTEHLDVINTLAPGQSFESELVTFTAKPRLYGRLVELNLTQQPNIVITLVPGFPSTTSAEPLTLLTVYSFQDIIQDIHSRRI